MKKNSIVLTIIILAVVLLISIKPISFYTVIATNGYNPLGIVRLDEVNKSQQSSERLIIVNDNDNAFNLIMMHNEKLRLWSIDFVGDMSTNNKPYSSLNWDEVIIDNDGDFKFVPHITVALAKDNNVLFNADLVDSNIKSNRIEVDRYEVIDFYSESESNSELDKLIFPTTLSDINPRF